MERYYGFDLGDAESAVSSLRKNDHKEPVILKIHEAGSFITAYAKLPGGQILIGESACYDTSAIKRGLRFKSRFLMDPESTKDVRTFAAGVLSELYGNGDLVQGEDACVYVGCPAGWDKSARERYRRIFEDVGYPPVRIVSESRAALISACQSKYFQVGYDILSKPVLVIDIGSSTTDFAYISEGREVELKTSGEVALGGGLMDEFLLEDAVQSSRDRKQIEEIFRESEPWKTYCEFTARRLKETYFSDEAYWQEQDCRKVIRILYDKPVELAVSIDEKTAKRMLESGLKKLNGQSFKSVFTESVRQVREQLGDQVPELLFLTGGVSKLPAIREWCEEIFPDSIVITGSQPEFSVSRGLAYSGRIDEELREFRQEVRDLVDSDVVERVVEGHLDDLYRRMVDTLVEPILMEVALPVFDQWRRKEIRRLSDIDQVLQKEIDAWLHSDAAQELLTRPVAAWLRQVAYGIEEYTMPICVRHNVPYHALSLNSYLSLSDIDIKIDARDVFAVEELTWMINTIISLIVGLLCGGSGIALISSGITGVVAGMTISLLVLVIGKESMQKALMHMDVPGPVRKMIPRSHFENRIDRITSEVKNDFYENLEKEKNDEISERLISEISNQLEMCLSRMAEIVEIPLGA